MIQLTFLDLHQIRQVFFLDGLVIITQRSLLDSHCSNQTVSNGCIKISMSTVLSTNTAIFLHHSYTFFTAISNLLQVVLCVTKLFM